MQVFKIEYYTDSCKYSISFFQSCFIFFIRSFVQTSFSRGYFVLYFSGMFFYSKVKYWLIFMIPLIHSTTFFFIPMMFLFRFMNPYMNKKSIIIMLLFVIILSNYQSIASLLLTFISGKIVFLDYILSRASEDTRYELGKLPIHQIGILLFIVVAIIVLNLKRVKYNDGLYKFYNVFVFLSVFILLNLRQDELSNRFYVFIWLFLPYFVIPFSKNISLAMLKSLIVIMWIVFYIYKYNSFLHL